MADPHASGHEDAGVDARAMSGLALAVWALIGASLLAVLALIAFLSGGAAAVASKAPRAAPNAPILQSTPANDLAALRAQKRTLLDRYAWIDRDRGLVRIPIERAIDLIVASRGAAAPGQPDRNAK